MKEVVISHDMMKILMKFQERCEILGVEVTDRHMDALRSVLGSYSQVEGKSALELLHMYKDGQLSEGLTSFWLDVDRVELRRNAL